MHVKMNDYVAIENKQTYITENPLAEVQLPIDCGEGINILQIPTRWMETITDLDLERVRTYPHTPELKEKIARIGRAVQTSAEIVFSSRKVPWMAFALPVASLWKEGIGFSATFPLSMRRRAKSN